MVKSSYPALDLPPIGRAWAFIRGKRRVCVPPAQLVSDDLPGQMLGLSLVLGRDGALAQVAGPAAAPGAHHRPAVKQGGLDAHAVPAIHVLFKINANQETHSLPVSPTWQGPIFAYSISPAAVNTPVKSLSEM